MADKKFFNYHQLSTTQIYKIKHARWKARTDLQYLCNKILGYKDVTTYTHGPLINFLQKFPVPNQEQWEQYDDFSTGYVKYRPVVLLDDFVNQEKVKRRLIIDSRGFFKTTINVVAHSIQTILNYPNISGLIIQSNIEKAESFLKEIKEHFQYNSIFRELFPEHVPYKKINDWYTKGQFTTEAFDPNNLLLGQPHREGTMITGGIDKGMAGTHVDFIKVSDIVDTVNSKSAESCNEITKQFNLCENLLTSVKYWIDVEGTRYSFADTYGSIIKREMALPEEMRKWKFYVRGCYKKKTKDGLPQKFTPEELYLPDLVDESAKNPRNPLGKVSWFPERAPAEDLEHARMTKPFEFACTPGYAEILMGDWTYKPISDVKIGEEIVGYEVNSTKRPGFIKGKVLDKGYLNKEVYEYLLEDGDKIECTEDHLWFSGPKNAKKNLPYRVAQINKPLYKAYTVDRTNSDFDWAYLSGIFDGEGHIDKQTGFLTISQSLKANPDVYEGITKHLNKMNILFRRYDRKDEPENSIFVLHGSRTLKINLLTRGKPYKGNRIRKMLDWRTKRLASPIKVINKKFVGIKKVFWLKTETGNYVSQGILSKNSQQYNNPMSAEQGMQPFPVNSNPEVGPLLPKYITRKIFDEKIPKAYYEISVDTAETNHQKSNYTAISVACWSGSGRCYIVDIIHGKFLPDTLIDNLFKAYFKYKPRNIKIEETSFVRGLMAGIKREGERLNVNLPIQLIKRENQTAKQERIINTLQPYYTTGQLIFLDDLKAKDKLLEELIEFPSGSQDDILDSLADFFQNKEYFGREMVREEDIQMENRERGAKLHQEYLRAYPIMVQTWLDTGNPFSTNVNTYIGNTYDRTGGL